MSKQVSAFRGSLDGYYQVEDSSGNFGEVFPSGNLTNFELTPNADELEVISTANSDYGQAADSMVDAKPTTASYTVNRFDIDFWGVAFMGEVSARSATSSAITGEEVTAVAGGLHKLANLGVSSLVVKDETDATTYVEGTDYEMVDAKLGIFRVIEAGSISEGDVLHCSYTKDAETGWLVEGGTKSSKYIRFWGRGINRFNNKECLVKIPRGSVRPSGGFSLVGTEAASIGMEMTITTPSDGSATFEVIEL